MQHFLRTQLCVVKQRNSRVINVVNYERSNLLFVKKSVPSQRTALIANSCVVIRVHCYPMGRVWGRGYPSQTHFEQTASLVNRLSESVDLARFNLHGFIANTGRWGDATIQDSHGTVSRTNPQIPQETGGPEWAWSGGCLRNLSSLAPNTHRHYYIVQIVSVSTLKCPASEGAVS
jgi:hypothetical protein